MKQIKRILFILLATTPGFVSAQDIMNVNIKVVDKFNVPLEGIQVKVKNHNTTLAVTNEKGEAALENLTTGEQIVVSSPCGAQQVVGVKGESVTVVMDGKSAEVFRGFNIKGRDEESTAAVSTVYSDQFRSSTTNPGNALYGMLPGLSVMQGNRVAWDNDPKLNVRGIGTLNSATPLVLVDGFERPISALTQEEIESVSVLKDAAALALYGLRGANGAILVKTKRGTYEGMKVSASYQFGVNTPYRLPKMANGYEYANAMNEALQLDGLSPRYSAQDIEAFRTGSNPELFPNVDWTKEALREHGYTHQATATFRGGSERVRYYSMLSYIGDDGLLKPVALNPDYNTQMAWDRLSLRTNLDISLTKSTQLKLNLLGQIAQFNRPATNYPTLFTYLYTTPSAAFPVKTSTGMWGGDNIRKNPVAEISAGGFSSSNDRALLADMRIEQDLSSWVKGLSAEIAVAFDNRSSYWDSKTKKYMYEMVMFQRDNSGNIGGITRTRYGQETDLNFSSELGFQNRVTTFEAKLNYGNSWGKDHVLNATALFHNEENSLKGQNNTYRRQSFIGNANYGFKNKYFVDVALSYSGSSVLNAGDRYRLFPAISGAWLISSEDFMKSATAINYLKLRASWGVTGSDIMDYDLGKYYFVMGGNSYYFGENNNGAGGHTEGRLANLKLSPEMSYKTNIGVELQLFNKLSFTADIFHDKRTNILVNAGSRFSSIIGVNTPLVNAGEVVNKGFETSLAWEDKIGDWTYGIGGNFSFAKNKIIEMNEEYKTEEYLKRTGHPVGQFFGLEAVGYFKDEADTQSGPVHSFSQVRPGDVKYKDQNKDGVIDNYDMVAQGYSTVLPEIYYGFNLNLGYKGFGFKADFQGIANYSIMKPGAMYMPLVNNTTVSEHYLANRWTPENQNAMYPRLSTLENTNNFMNSSIWLENGAFLKLRNVELNYSLPKSLISKVKAQKIQVFVRGENLFSLDHVKVLDPEMMNLSYPSYSSYHVGFSLDF